MKPIRQGDVLLLPVTKLPKGAVDRNLQQPVVLKIGEAVGHAHQFLDHTKVRMWDAGAERFIQVIEQADLIHDEHTTIQVPPGLYKLPDQVEYTPGELRKVSD